jgi:AAA domain
MKELADPLTTVAPPGAGIVSTPTFDRHGDEISLTWAFPPVTMKFTGVRERGDGPRAELVVTHGDQEIHWGLLSLASTSARETVIKKLVSVVDDVPWRLLLERACRVTVDASRRGEPLVTLTGRVTSPSREVLPRLLYEGEPTAIIGDGDTGKSLVAMAVAAAVESGAALPFGLKPARPVPVAYLDWETSRDTVETRVALIAAGLGIDPPAIKYKRMTRPLVDQAVELAADFARLGIGLVIIDSMMFAVAGGDGAAFHEPITSFYNSLRLFAPAASLVLNHITNADARSGTPARPFGGAFAFNGPRLIWEARRDQEIDDATAIVFTCKKANNLPRKPAPFGLRFQPGDSTITVYPLDLAEAAPKAVASLSVSQQIELALRKGPRSVEQIAEAIGKSDDVTRRTLNRRKATFLAMPDTKPQLWALKNER